MKFVIEHLEPELFEWCLIEYEHISKIIGIKNLFFTNIQKKDFSKLRKYGKVFWEKISELNSEIFFDRFCVLNQYSKKTLTTSDKTKFEYFVFGGILGDNPAKQRTNFLIRELKNSHVKFEERNLGSKQMPTDNAIYLAKKILDGKNINDFKFIDEVEIEINGNESVVLPFRYVINDNKLVISEKLVKYLRKREEF